MDKAFCSKFGIDYDNGLNNCMGDIAFYQKILASFLEDHCFPDAKAAYARKDYDSLFEHLHELKGVCGNVALSGLYQAVSPLVERLRSHAFTEAELVPLFEAVETAYHRTCEGIVAMRQA